MKMPEGLTQDEKIDWLQKNARAMTPDEHIEDLRQMQREAREHLAEGRHSECGGTCKEEMTEFIAQLDRDIARFTN